MAATKKSKNKKKLPGKKAKTKPSPKQRPSYTELLHQLAETRSQLKEALEQQSGTSEILRVIASSPPEIQPVLDAVAERAAKLCDAGDAGVWRVDGDRRYRVAHFGTIPTADAPGGGPIIDRDTPPGRAIVDRKTIHVHDLQAAEGEFPGAKTRGIALGVRTLLAIPLLHEGVAIGAIQIRRQEARPFSDRQIKLLETFADQAVIAIENVRLFKELGERNSELREALEHQTATSEVLGIISRSPTDVQPVLDAIVESAARVVGIDDVVLRLRDGKAMVARAHFGPMPVPANRSDINIDEPHYRWIREHGTLHVPDLSEWSEFQFVNVPSWRSRLTAPLRQQGELVGVLNARRIEVRPFTPAQIKLLETFASQAVIAIENVRLFQELKESLEQQTATSEILGVIASSPTDVQPVLDTVIANAVTLAGAKQGHIRQYDGEFLRVVAHYNESTEQIATLQATPTRPGLESLTGRAFLERQANHVLDVQAEAQDELSLYKLQAQNRELGMRTLLAIPLLREGAAIGTISIWRDFVEPFTDRQIDLVKTFADQAVIAIENVRLFKELQERNAELREALEHQTATSEVLGIISRSPTDVQPVLDAIVESAARVCGIDDVVLRLRDADSFVPRAHFGPIPISRIEISIDEPQFRWMRENGTLHVPDVRAQSEFPTLGPASGYRTLLAAPLRQQGEFIGMLNARRTSVRPFTPAQIKLLETFADQAVIAIENVRLFNELKESLEQQTATSEILGVIASSPTDIQPVLNTVAENAARLCEATDAQIRLVEGDGHRLVASFGTLPAPDFRITNLDNPFSRSILTRETTHIDDVQEQWHQPASGTRTLLSTPMLREGTPIGLINIRRTEVRPFSEKHIKLLETFADQAVIAIENVRLFKELQERNRDLTEALEQQTATSEILRAISSSPTDLQPVFETILANVTRLCGTQNAALFRFDGEFLRFAAGHNLDPETMARMENYSVRPGTETASRRAALEGRTIHVPDVVAAAGFDAYQTDTYRRENRRSTLAVPLLKEETLLGVIVTSYYDDVRPFTDNQIKLVETFADQAVIAIENVRLFNELEERTTELIRSVGELKALGEVGQAVSSTLDLETVLTRIVSHAVQLSGTDAGAIYEYDEQSEEFLLRATDHMEEELINALRTNPPRLADGLVGKAALGRQPIEVPDISQEPAYPPRMRQMLAQHGFKASLAVPLLREERIIGALVIRRKATGSFRPEVTELLKTFATQSVLAIQNARLFREIEDKSRQIEAANRHKSEFLANMSHELRTPLNAIIGFSEVLQEKLFGELNEKQTEYTADILTSGQHLLSLINEILDLSKVEAGRMELETASFDLPLAIDNARTFVRERATKHGITLDLSVDERLGDFVGDERKIKQILLNLLSNAVKFTPEGGRVGIDARQTDGGVEISVTDTGIGIAPEDQPKIFEEFRQVGAAYAHKSEGTGLGLTLAKKFVELHGGKIWLESAIGRGSKFTFFLPQAQRSDDGTVGC